ncbi:Flp family type IVb pilin [Vibrio natriegens]|uniref:Flp family type IVb pilin n=1 Tax=Vibrio natriegens TaxID=691 RepID=UPI00390B5C51
MDKFTQVLKDFWNDEEGLTLLEYILGAALIVAAVIGSGFWQTMADKFKEIGTAVDTAGDNITT